MGKLPVNSDKLDAALTAVSGFYIKKRNIIIFVSILINIIFVALTIWSYPYNELRESNERIRQIEEKYEKLLKTKNALDLELQQLQEKRKENELLYAKIKKERDLYLSKLNNYEEVSFGPIFSAPDNISDSVYSNIVIPDLKRRFKDYLEHTDTIRD